MKGTDLPGSADFAYYNWVDQFDTLGLGANVPIMTGSGSDSLLALDPETASSSSCACRIRSASTHAGSTAGSTIRRAAGRAAASGPTTGRTWCGTSRAATDARSSLVKFQLRPDPLAK